ncbi:hypothetical protein AM228_03355 [Planktothricoides sp. SR001]|nr:hypothetical protein AM228_03355 [Planktothricoides sp. SR001]
MDFGILGKKPGFWGGYQELSVGSDKETRFLGFWGGCWGKETGFLGWVSGFIVISIKIAKIIPGVRFVHAESGWQCLKRARGNGSEL